jgi:hypothetical protein
LFIDSTASWSLPLSEIILFSLVIVQALAALRAPKFIDTDTTRFPLNGINFGAVEAN